MSNNKVFGGKQGGPRACLLGLIAVGATVISGCVSTDVPVRYRHAVEAGAYRTVVTEWGVLTGTDPKGERVVVQMQGPAGREYKCRFEAYGHVTDSWCADLDADGKPEVVVTTESYGTGAYGEVWVATIRGETLTAVHMPELSDEVAQGYRGHDTFEKDERRVIRKFPIYAEDDANITPSGGERTIGYTYGGKQLVPAEVRDSR